MIVSPSPLGYLDALIAGIRAFGKELEQARAWRERAKNSEALNWRLTLLSASRKCLENAARHLSETEARMRDLGPAELLLPPLDRLTENLRTMRNDWQRESETLADEERNSTPLGHT